MAKITEKQLIEEIRKKGFRLKSKYEEYKNLTSAIVVTCPKEHEIHTNLKTIRTSNFTCPVCVGEASKGFKNEPVNVPEKKGFRLVAFDNATQNVGVSVFDDDKLVYYGVFRFTKGTSMERILDIREMLEKEIFPKWKPDFVQVEDAQLQNGQYKTYEVLLKALGVFELACVKFGVEYSRERSSVWRSHFNINKRNRTVEKKLAMELVNKMYGIDVQDDTAEAILIGKYRIDQIKKEQIKDLF